MTAYEEKRRHGRVSVDVHVDWGLTPDCPESGRLVSFSDGGCFILTAEEVPPGARVFVNLWLPAGLTEGEVRRRVENAGFGVEFKRDLL